ncbi:MAG: uracil-DNA glycosylase [Pseudomonadota bacterium]
MTDTAIALEAGWLAQLEQEFRQPYMQSLKAFLRGEKDAGKVVYPPGKLMFAALNETPLESVRAVILGQDPYHGPGQAHGLCFSVRPGTAVPPSLQNIYKELQTDLGVVPVQHGCLLPWARQGVLLLNSVLSVERGQAASHQGRGWEQFTDRIIEIIDRHCEHVVFLLWGSHAQRKGAKINGQKHCVLKAPHPSPLSAHRGFFGCRHFSQTNAYLAAQRRSEIGWQLPPDADGFVPG